MPQPQFHVARVLGLAVLALMTLSARAAALVETPVPYDTATGTEAPSIQKQRAAFDALARRDFAAAQALFQEAAALEPASPRPWLGLAEVARTTGDADGARRALSRALELAPNDAPTLSAWGAWHYARSEFDQAEEYWNKALTSDERHVRTLLELGGLELNVRGRTPAAEALFRRAIATEPAHGGAHNALGTALWRQGNLDGALQAFETAARLAPGNPLPLDSQGRIHAQAGRIKPAIQAFDRALAAAPRYFPARLAKADLLANTGRPKEALAEVRTVLRDEPKLAQAHLKAGMLEQMLGRNEQAMIAYREVLTHEPANALALNNLAGLASQSGSVPDHGLQWAQRAVALAPGEPRFKNTLAFILHRQGESAQAVAILEPQVKGPARANPDSHYLLGLIYAETGQKSKAIAALRESLKLNRSFSNAADATRRLRELEAGG